VKSVFALTPWQLGDPQAAVSRFLGCTEITDIVRKITKSIPLHHRALIENGGSTNGHG
jgi:hypothetical protein